MLCMKSRVYLPWISVKVVLRRCSPDSSEKKFQSSGISGCNR